MLRRTGCLTPSALLFTIGCILVIGGLMAESSEPIRYGVAFLIAAAVLLIAAIILGRRGWWY